jgi:hypothetical protein
MHDGSIIHDESTTIGRVATTARKVLYTLPTTKEEDDLAGVSMMMKALPSRSSVPPVRIKPVIKTRTKTKRKRKKS